MISLLNDIGNDNCRVNEIRENVFINLRTILIFYYRSGALLNEYHFDKVEKHERVVPLLKKILDIPYLERMCEMINECYDFAIIKSENEFLISDQYVSTVALSIKNRFFSKSNRHMGLKGVMILIPVTSSYYVVYFNGRVPDYIKNNEINTLNKNEVKEINGVIINNSYKKCVGNKESILEEAMGLFEYQSNLCISAGGPKGSFGSNNKKEVFFYKEHKVIWEFFVSMDWTAFIGTERNDKCKCGSDKKFKKCCINKFNGANRIMKEIEFNNNTDLYRINGRNIVEKRINEFSSK